MKTFLPLFLLAVVPVLSGCVSSKYKLAKSDTPPAVALNLAAAPVRPSSPSGSDVAGAALSKVAVQPSLEAMVNTVIVYQGPGSWKRAAYWDEYVVTLANRSPMPFTIESATLTDFQSLGVTPGDNPWDLEKQSHRYEARVLSSVGDVLKVGGATVLTSTAAGGVAVLGALSASSQLGVAMVVGGTVMFAAATVVVPVWSVVANVNGRHDVEAEYRRRRLSLPLFLVPGQVAQGSFFFRISPGPQRLVLRGRAGDQPCEATIDLTPLSGLHLKAAAPVAAANAQQFSNP